MNSVGDVQSVADAGVVSVPTVGRARRRDFAGIANSTSNPSLHINARTGNATASALPRESVVGAAATGQKWQRKAVAIANGTRRGGRRRTGRTISKTVRTS